MDLNIYSCIFFNSSNLKVNLYRIDNASCTCPAGLGEACCLISAVGYAVVMPWSQGFAGKSEMLEINPKKYLDSKNWSHTMN